MCRVPPAARASLSLGEGERVYTLRLLQSERALLVLLLLSGCYRAPPSEQVR